MRRWLVLVAVAGCGRVGFEAQSDGGALDASAVRRRTITITNSGTTTVNSGYSVPVDVAGVLDDQQLATVRVLQLADAIGARGVDRVIDRETRPAAIWFALSNAIAAGGSDQYWLEYGDPTITAPADPAGVFLLSDDFSSLRASWNTLGAHRARTASSCSARATSPSRPHRRAMVSDP